MQKQQITEQKSTLTKLSDELPVKKRINRLTFLLSSKLAKAENKENFLSAILLLNHALMTSEYDEAMALKIFNIAKRIARSR
jgi:type II secretory pathway component PulL